MSGIRCKAVGVAALLVLGGLAMPALGELPGAMDYVPENAIGAMVIRNLGEFHTDLESLQKTIPNAEFDLGKADVILGANGLNSGGSLALVLLPSEDGMVEFDPKSGNGPLVLIVPVNDFGAFVGGFGAQAGPGVIEIEAMGATLFVKNLGGGFCAMSPDQGLMDNFDGEGGHGAAHEAMLGVSGVSLVEDVDTSLIINLGAVRFQLGMALEGALAQARMFAPMAGAQAEQLVQQLDVAETMAKGLVRDGQAALIGIDLSKDGFAFEFATNFDEGSEFAGFFTGAGDAAALLDRIPKTDFFFAGAADYSSEGMRGLMAMMDEASGDTGMPGWNEVVGSSTGIAAVVGTTPAIMGGLLANSSVYYDVDDGAKFIGEQRALIEGFNGKANGPISFETSFSEQAMTIAGRMCSKWSLRIVPDASQPSAMQMQQMMAMIYGPAGGPAGFMCSVDGGVVQTLAMNEGTMATAIGAATGQGSAFGSDPGVRAVMAHLPEDASFYEFVGINGIIDAVGGVMMMMGGGLPFEAPKDLMPVAIAGTTDHGGIRMKVFVPSEVISAMVEIGEAMEGEPAAADADDGGKPQF